MQTSAKHQMDCIHSQNQRSPKPPLSEETRANKSGLLRSSDRQTKLMFAESFASSRVWLLELFEVIRQPASQFDTVVDTLADNTLTKFCA